MDLRKIPFVLGFEQGDGGFELNLVSWLHFHEGGEIGIHGDMDLAALEGSEHNEGVKG
jgi:hypothetical protein